MTVKEQVPEVQYSFYGEWPVRGMFYENDVWLVAKDLITPFGIPYEGEKSIAFIPEQWRRYIKGSSPHGIETFLCLSEPGIMRLLDQLIALGY
jgi:hypothetical protein